ncbi:hypothetical protein HRG_000965 [Hirsutella rhossiliensis]|uniref:Uncharacterized protein n=1 Tax=Hirsutella rhossiliensis TaxID=111463 RepID=A0A9P8N632_9HYPO|nr:uncharacterized protein HRG_00965 [Hirsutella rhossiliensis]KAH0968323.1 hypothetical protein HRG_00965 [Hirsutella rhossiliensis]
MPSSGPFKDEVQQHSVPEAASSSTPSRSNPVHQSSARSRGSPLPSRKRQAKQPLHIRMNLTETQMDKITAAFTNKVNDSPVRARPRVEVTPAKPPSGPQQGDSGSRRNKSRYSLSSSGDEDSQKPSTTFSDLMPRRQGDIFSASLAERRQQHPPTPLQVADDHAPSRTPHRLPMESVSHAVSPLSPTQGGRYERAGSEQLSPDWPSPQTEWLPRASTNSHVVDENVNGPVLDMYRAWARLESPADYAESSFRVQSLAQRPRRSKSTSDGLRRADGFAPASPPPPPLPAKALSRSSGTRATESPLFSPLALYFRGQDFPSTKKGEKTLIGQNGWLERTGFASGRDQKVRQKKTGILESIKKIAKDMTAEFHNNNRRSQAPVKEVSVSHIRISLDAREQSLLYCELEFHLTAALNDFITAELDRGHLVPDNLKKVSDWWANQGRPKVVGFRYDLETQLQLVSLHVNDFNFYGRRQSNPVEIGGLLDAMKTNARQMRIRTFCQPDSVVAKQLVDAQSLFNMINVSSLQQAALAEVAQFFKVIVEREREREQHERRVRDRQSQHHHQRHRCESHSVAYQSKDHDHEVDEDPLPYAR